MQDLEDRASEGAVTRDRRVMGMWLSTLQRAPRVQRRKHQAPNQKAQVASWPAPPAVLMLGHGVGVEMAHCILGQIPDPQCTSQEAPSSRKAPAGSPGVTGGSSGKVAIRTELPLVLQQTDLPTSPRTHPSTAPTSLPPSNPRQVPSSEETVWPRLPYVLTWEESRCIVKSTHPNV